MSHLIHWHPRLGYLHWKSIFLNKQHIPLKFEIAIIYYPIKINKAKLPLTLVLTIFWSKITKKSNFSSVGPSVDFFHLPILWKPEHQIYIFCWNFCWDLKSNLCPLLVQCGGWGRERKGAIHPSIHPLHFKPIRKDPTRTTKMAASTSRSSAAVNSNCEDALGWMHCILP